MRRIVVANVDNEKEVEFNVGTTSEFVARARYGDHFFEVRPGLCLDLANRFLDLHGVTNIEGFTFGAIISDRKYEVLIVVEQD